MGHETADPYRDWDAAYLLGALSPAERREYEEHLATCPDCSAEVAALAGMPGVLSVVPRERALELLAAEPDDATPVDLMPRLADATRRIRRRARYRVVALAAAAAAVAAVTVWAVPRTLPSEAPVADRSVVLGSEYEVPLSAEAQLVSEPWGTRIEMSCRYDPPSPGSKPPTSKVYAMYVTDRSGKATEVATWRADPGTEARPDATTTLPLDQIAAVDIRTIDTGRVVLRADL
ncbi:MAG TPA: zf-HC2 domain-containing protein [Kribbellaceae bacterium]|nr:zf-HC2 domain-containing protein [Kribbellaceae bacterium]